MAPANRIDRVDAEPPGLTAGAVPDIADDIADMLRRGRTVGGEAVQRVMFRLADGRQVSADLPRPRIDRAPVDEDEEGETEPPVAEDRTATVLRMLRGLKSGEWMAGKAIAGVLGLKVDGGHFKAIMKPLKDDGIVESHNTHGYRLRPRPD